MRLIIKIGQIILQIIYEFFKLFPVKNKIVMISRQSNDPSLDFILLCDEIKKEAPACKVVFLCKTLDGGVDSTFRRKLGYMCHMFCQMYHLATSKVAILDTYCIVVSLLKHRKDLQVIQMWHSMGTMKLFGYTAVGTGEGSSIKVAENMHMHENYTYFIAASPNYKEHLAKGFRCDVDKAFISPLPRYDLLKSKEYKGNKREEIFSTYPELRSKKVILYCPTFRKNEVQMQTAVDGLIDNLPDGYSLVVKLHPLSKVDLGSEKVSTAEDFTSFDMLFAADYVISDYSCIIYEAGILGLPLCFYAFDLDAYIQNRGLAIDYEKEMPGVISGDPKIIMNTIKNNNINVEKVRSFTDKYVEPTDNATKKITEFILAVGRVKSER